MQRDAEHVDVLIVGAGLSGIGAACHLRSRLPGRTVAILEARDAIGGTWDLFRYPGVRSDSDMFTLGYAFRPWEDPKVLADGPSILEYVRAAAREHGVDRHVRFSHRVTRAEWSSADARWTVEAQRTDTGARVRLTCGLLYCCTGYYRYDEGHTPQFEGTERFRGRIVHPQHWPADLDHTGRRVAVIGSGATAVTLVPALAERAAHVTMVQRSPSYVLPLPEVDPLADLLRRVLPARAAYPLLRWKNALLALLVFTVSRRSPRLAKALLRRVATARLPAGYAVDPHFRPRYDPWDQRLCIAPGGDLFQTISAGRASVVTGAVDTFTETGLRMASGAEVEADVVVTATGLNLLLLGGMTVVVDGREVDLSACVGYKGMMLSGVPNLVMTLGYTNASWTLKADLVAEHACRLLAHMDEHGHQVCTPLAPGAGVPTEPFIDLAAGYVQRSAHLLPRQGPRPPWRLNQNYVRDVLLLRHGRVDDEGLVFSRAGARAAGPAAPPEPAQGGPAAAGGTLVAP